MFPPRHRQRKGLGSFYVCRDMLCMFYHKCTVLRGVWSVLSRGLDWEVQQWMLICPPRLSLRLKLWVPFLTLSSNTVQYVHIECMLFSALTIVRLPHDGEEDLILWRVLIEDTERWVGDDDSGVLLHVDATDWHHGLSVPFTLQREENKVRLKITSWYWIWEPSISFYLHTEHLRQKVLHIFHKQTDTFENSLREIKTGLMDLPAKFA